MTHLMDGAVLANETDVSSNAGCGLTNNPDGFIYSNTGSGIVRINATTGAPTSVVFGAAGNALGITTDPQTRNLVYVGSDGTILTAAPAGSSSTFSSATTGDFVDGIAFDPTGNFLFVSNRTLNVVTIIARSGALVQNSPVISGVPDGISFHGLTPKFVVTSNNNGTMSRLDFPNNDYTQTPTASTFASGGYRGDLSQVGADGCVYVTQEGTNFPDGTTSGNNSIVKICPGFAPPPGEGGVRIAVLGDSFASGEGSWSTDSSHLPIDYYGGEEGGSSYPQSVVSGFNTDSASASDHCHRSPAAPGILLGAAETDFVACSGANIQDVINGSNGEKSQLKILSPMDTEVLLSISGDDFGFTDVLKACVQVPFVNRGNDNACQSKISEEEKTLPSVMRRLQNDLLSRVITMTNGAATIVLIGYPHLFPDGGHDGCNGISAQSQRDLNDATDTVDNALQTLASSYIVPAVQFVDTRPVFHGHAVCGDSLPYFNDLQLRDVAFANNCPADYATATGGIGALICTQSFHPDNWGYIAEALMLSKVIPFASAAPLLPLVHFLCDRPLASDYCATLPR